MKKRPGDIKVRGDNRMCFWVDPKTLEPRGCEMYDAHAFSDPEPVPTMSYSQWVQKRLVKLQEAMRP